jgi:6,7-dimethyl-8-ribityllumazine synthase
MDLIRVPGSFELPQAAKLAAQSGRYAGIIVLGTVIRGGTPHFDMIAAEVTKGAAQVALDTGLPLAFGVLTTDSVEQAIDRAGAKMGNKGWEAAMSVLEMVDLTHTLGARKGKK